MMWDWLSCYLRARGNGIARLYSRLEARKDAAILRNRPGAVVNSSISDAGLYPAFCQWASNDEKVFGRFRRSRIYTDVLEHVTREQGWAYIQHLEPGLLSRLDRVLSNDAIGKPARWCYRPYGVISPTTLRYAKVSADLHRLFGSLDGLGVAEIGVGYGGQFRVLNSLWSPSAYYLFDLPEVLSLARRFLMTAGVDSHVLRDFDGREPCSVEVDLVISNYAFSELERSVQERYLEELVEKAPRGYFTYNHISSPALQSLTAQQLADRIPGARLLPEEPETFPGNVIVVWGAH